VTYMHIAVAFALNQDSLSTKPNLVKCRVPNCGHLEPALKIIIANKALREP